MELLYLFCLFLLLPFAAPAGMVDSDCLKKVQADVFFVMDTSANVGKVNFEYYSKSYVMAFIKKVSIGSSHVEIGSGTFGKNFAINSRPSDIVDKLDLLTELGHIPFASSSESLFDEALRKLSVTNIFTERAVPKYVVIIASGASVSYSESVTAAIESWKGKAKLVVVSVGGGGLTENMSAKLKSAGARVYNLAEYKELNLDNVDFLDELCVGKKQCDMEEIARLQASIQKTKEERMRLTAAHRSAMSILIQEGRKIDGQVTVVQMRIQKLEARKVSASEEYISIVQKVEMAKMDISRLEVALLRSKRRVTDLIDIASTINKTIQITEQNSTNVKAEIDSYKKSFESIDQEIIKIRYESSSTHAQIESLTSELLSIQQYLYSTQQSIEQQSLTITSMKSIWEERMRIVINKISKFKLHVQTMTTKTEELRIRESTIIDQRRVLVEKIQTITQTRTTVLLELTQFTKQIEQLNVEYTSLVKSTNEVKLQFDIKVERSETRLQEFRSNYKQLAVFAERLTRKYELVISQKREQSVISEKLRLEMTELKVKISSLVQSIRSYHEEIQKSSYELTMISRSTSTMTDKYRRCEDYTKTGGCFLIFAMKSGSGLNVSDVFGSEKYAYSKAYKSTAKFYKNDVMRYWTRGTFKRVTFSFMKRGVAVVELKFDAETAGPTDWFTNRRCISGAPWNLAMMKEFKQYSYFSMKGDSSSARSFYIATKSAESSCRAKGYCGVVERDSCGWSTGKTPKFLYTLKTDGNEDYFSNALQADELRIHACPYELDVKQSQSSGGYSVVMAYSSNFKVSPLALYEGTLTTGTVAPPSSKDLCNCWYLSDSLRTWTASKFFSLRLDILSDSGVVGAIEFLGNNANNYNWFDVDKVIGSSTWSSLTRGGADFSLLGYKGNRESFMEISGDKTMCGEKYFVILLKDSCGIKTEGKPKILYSSENRPVEMSQMKVAKEVRLSASVTPVSFDI